MTLTRPIKIVLWFFITILITIATIAGFIWWQLTGSLAQLTGSVEAPALTEQTFIQRDNKGLVTISGKNRNDIAYALGFTHAQERFFQMDLLRRNSAGELSVLFGNIATDVDLKIRTHQFRKRAEAAAAALPEEHQQLLVSYTNGVNTGIHNLRSIPFEYSLLRTQPQDWVPADSLLVTYSMYMDLQQEWAEGERSLAAMQDLLPTDWFNFLTPKGGEWDAPIEGLPYQYDGTLPKTPLSDFQQITTATKQYQYADQIEVGSNNWSVSGALTSHGSALVANDMHLGLEVPNIWFRASWILPDTGRRITGATLPGVPLMIVGSNEHIAWGFTNSYGDYMDVIRLQTNAEGSEYLTPDGWKVFETSEEVIQVKGQQPVTIAVMLTQWGPVIGEDHFGNKLAMRWVAHDVEGLNLNLLELENADTVEQAVKIAASTGIPGQNFNVGDREGKIAWTIMGRLPKRIGFATPLSRSLPSDWSDGTKYWAGMLNATEYPSVINPSGQRLWSANARVASTLNLNKVGNGLYALGARQKQIKDRLENIEHFNELSFLTIHLDDRAVFLDRWQQLLVKLIDEDALTNNPQLEEFKAELDKWNGRAATSSIGYFLVKRYREMVIDNTVGHLFRYVDSKTNEFWPDDIDNLVEYPVWQLITEQPEQHTPSPYSNWSEFLIAVAVELNAQLSDEELGLTTHTWGDHNQLSIQHPLSKAVPFLAPILDMKAVAMPGDSYMPRVQSSDFGASQRMAVSPGHEDTGYFHMATGQSGHPLSPFYRAGHNDWVEGKPSPFLPGEPKHVLELKPEI